MENVIKSSEKNNERNISFDIIKIAALIFVIFNHTGVYGYEIFMNTDSKFMFGLSVFINLFCKAGVPLFLMVSGALLLGKSEDIKTLLVKRVLRIFIVLVAASFMYYIRLFILHPEYGFSLKYFVKYIYSNPIVTPFWFLYIYIAFLLMLPFLRKIAQGISISELFYLIILQLIMTYISIPETVAGFSSVNISLQVLEITVFYPVLGYAISKYLADIQNNIRNKKTVALLGSVCIVMMNYLVTIFMMNVEFKNTGMYSELYINKFAFIPTLFIFVGMFFINNKNGLEIHPFIKKVVFTVAGASLVIFIFEEMLRIDILSSVFAWFSPAVPGLIVCIPYIVCMLGMGTVIALCLKHIYMFVISILNHR